jgi:hypothetical protein
VKPNDVNLASALTQAQATLSPERLAALKTMSEGEPVLKAYDAPLAAATEPKPN